MPGQITYTDDLNGVLSRIETDPDSDVLLIVTLRRLAVICANRQDGPELIEDFSSTYYSELSEIRYRWQLEAVLRGGRN